MLTVGGVFSSATLQVLPVQPTEQPMQNFSSCESVVPSVLVLGNVSRPDTALGGSPPPASTLLAVSPVKGLTAYALASPRLAAQAAVLSMGRFVEKNTFPLTASGAFTPFSPVAKLM